MHYSLEPSNNLKKLQDLPSTTHWVKNEAVHIYGDIILYTRNHGILDKVSSESRRSCVLTKDGDLVVYMKEKKGFVLDLHSLHELLLRSDTVRCKKKNVQIKRCKLKLRFKFGTVNVTLYEKEIPKWRDGISAVLEGTAHDPIVVTQSTGVQVVPPPVEKKAESPPVAEEEEMVNEADLSSLSTSEIDHSMIRPDYEVYTVTARQTEQPVEESEMETDDLPSDFHSTDLITQSSEESEEEEEPTPPAVRPSFPPHRSANICLIRPRPPRNLPVFIPPSDAPPFKPPRTTLSVIMESKISVFEPVATDTVSASRSATMPRKLSRMAENGPATLPRSISSCSSHVRDMDLFKESAE